MSAAPHSRTGHRRIESDRVLEQPVFDREGERIGIICRLLIERRSGLVDSVLVRAHALLGLVAHEYEVPWNSLRYDTRLAGYRSDLRKGEILAANSTQPTDPDADA